MRFGHSSAGGIFSWPAAVLLLHFKGKINILRMLNSITIACTTPSDGEHFLLLLLYSLFKRELINIYFMNV